MDSSKSLAFLSGTRATRQASLKESNVKEGYTSRKFMFSLNRIRIRTTPSSCKSYTMLLILQIKLQEDSACIVRMVGKAIEREANIKTGQSTKSMQTRRTTLGGLLFKTFLLVADAVVFTGGEKAEVLVLRGGAVVLFIEVD